MSCCQPLDLEWECRGGMMVFRRIGRSTVYSAKCKVCGELHLFTAPQMRKAMTARRKAEAGAA